MSVTFRLAVTASAITEINSDAPLSDDRSAEHNAGGRIGHDLDEATRVAVDERPGVGGERHLRHPDLATDGEGLGLGQAHVGDLGLGEDRAGRLVVVEMAMLTRVEAHHVFGDLATLHRRHRGQR